MFKIGQKVKVKVGGHNASDFNRDGINIMGIYQLKEPHNEIFEIEGTVKLITFEHDPKIECAYLLKCEGRVMGYVYDNAIEKLS